MPPSLQNRFLSLFNFFGPYDAEDSLPRSPVRHLLKSNTAPTEEERTKIEDVLSLVGYQEANLQQRLKDNPFKSDPTYKQIRHILDKTQVFIHDHQSLLSLIRVLPDEILALIFLTCLPDVESGKWQQMSWATIDSFRLSQVCRRWRNIAITTPGLWTILGDVRLDGIDSNHGLTSYSRSQAKQANALNASYLNFIEEALRRSREMDLWVYIFAPYMDYSDVNSPIIPALMKHEHRLAVLGIDGSVLAVQAVSEPLRSPASNPYYSFRRLRKLYLDLRRVEPRTINGFSKAPVLTEVTISRCLPHRLLLPFGQLQIYREDLAAGPVNYTCTLAHVLKYARSLEKLDVFTLGYTQDWLNGSIVTGTQVLEKLKILAMRLDSQRQSAHLSKDILDNLVLPSLKELRLGGYTHDLIPVATSLFRRSTLPGSAFPLRKLYLRHIFFNLDQLSALIEATPQLEELNTDLPYGIAVADFVKLAIRGTRSGGTTTGPLEPRLKSLVLHMSKDGVEKEQNTFLSLPRTIVESRQVIADLKARERYNLRAYADSTDFIPHFRLVLPDMFSTRYAQKILNLWLDETRPFESLSATEDAEIGGIFGSFYRRLHTVFPLLNKDHSPKRKGTFIQGFVSALDGILREIEAQVLVPGWEVACLYISQLHVSLLRLSELPDDWIPEDTEYQFRNRAKQIVNGWEPIILADLRNRKIKWALKGRRSLIYVFEDDEFHVSPSVDAVYDGLKDPNFEDIVWSEAF